MDAAVRTNNALRAENAVVPEAVGSGVSWASIAAGAVAAAALSLALLAFGAGLGLSSISPWADSGVSASTFKNGAGAYLVIVAVISSAVGGYLAARLRTRWVGLDSDEVFFRDTAHGFIAWAFATIISAAVLGAATAQFSGELRPGLESQPVKPRRASTPRRSMSTACSGPTRRLRRQLPAPTRTHGPRSRACGPPSPAQMATSRPPTEPTSRA